LDHEWGRNITELGLGDLRASMAAHQLDVTPDNVYMLNNLRFGFYMNAHTVAPEHVRWHFNFVNPVPGHPHFPYGRSVEPDAPV